MWRRLVRRSCSLSKLWPRVEGSRGRRRLQPDPSVRPHWQEEAGSGLFRRLSNEFRKGVFTTQTRCLLVWSSKREIVFITSPQSVQPVLTWHGREGERFLNFLPGPKVPDWRLGSTLSSKWTGHRGISKVLKVFRGLGIPILNRSLPSLAGVRLAGRKERRKGEKIREGFCFTKGNWKKNLDLNGECRSFCGALNHIPSYP